MVYVYPQKRNFNGNDVVQVVTIDCGDESKPKVYECSFADCMVCSTVFA